jgi:hypothetical protein
MFDFNPTTFGIKMQVEEDLERKKGVRRYAANSVPYWFNIDL